MRRASIVVLVVVALMAAGIAAVWSRYEPQAGLWSFVWSRDKFTSDVWHETPRKERHRLYRDLVSSEHIRPTTTRDDVFALLGPPDWADADQYPTRVTYGLARGAQFPLDFNSVYVLEIGFSNDGHVLWHQVRGD